MISHATAKTCVQSFSQDEFRAEKLRWADEKDKFLAETFYQEDSGIRRFVPEPLRKRHLGCRWWGTVGYGDSLAWCHSVQSQGQIVFIERVVGTADAGMFGFVFVRFVRAPILIHPRMESFPAEAFMVDAYHASGPD